ncbi:tRNA preQ1(34) S-adenosylmethionine ribosyltransferase-isomerase QueA [Sporosarcina thermotolerans]|uniref:S-adenosylmethionine:tRNA ribosyltransferase-isomerase n=1 Tax=Sporosarcina thermotolerans TaxID=633404 RepID=A0AAW9AD06_9BACL|nr:tRNA preQ1(34) S-adenosylmethionine ribosyltransferase-isomerase QueA [Sporosarcina thermotolerans]MDW0118084.1 tRNA preQ1(34) S-adenosylmethionine ribosyltransferase-isomerase QueA [Sporosarcina thermotolerans]WHT47578.1 tRNA preQ1(34) S-adenosylmethionine ribosyltransferase-isomerase QueA [Sporosarcina thermotolerans]
MDVNDFDFELPESLIAQTPLKDRTASRLMVLDKVTGEIEHHQFRQIVDELQAGDVLVLNDTRVLPARLIGIKEDTGASIEVLLLKEYGQDEWETLVKPAKRVKVGTVISFGNGTLQAECTEILEQGGRVFQFRYEGIFYEILDELGQMPLPPYITETLDDQSRYQTVFAKERGSAAAPTAGLHFTEEILQEIRDKGVGVEFITLHVGLGTFRPVSSDTIEEHTMHSEYYHVTESAANAINEAKLSGGNVIAVGTTSARTLETIASQNNGKIVPTSGWTSIFIYPGYEFSILDGMLTNFHLPKSTLIMLISAMTTRDHILAAYKEAVKEKYRFFSFGDAMFIKPPKK